MYVFSSRNTPLPTARTNILFFINALPQFPSLHTTIAFALDRLPRVAHVHAQVLWAPLVGVLGVAAGEFFAFYPHPLAGNALVVMELAHRF